MSDAQPISDTSKNPPAEAILPQVTANQVTDDIAHHEAGGDQQGQASWMMTEVHKEWDSLKLKIGLPVDSKSDSDNAVLEVPNAFKADAATSSDGSWWKGMTKSVANFVETGWDNLSDTVNGAYKSILDDSDNKTVQVQAKLGADGKPDYFESSSDNGTRKLSADELRFTDSKGATIIRDTKSGEITSQSADGEDIYTRKADGTQIYRSKNVEYTRTADGKYEARDDQGHVTEVGDKGAITKIDEFFKVAQRITTIDATTAKPERGQVETMSDGQRYMDAKGDIIVARDNGVREITTAQGQHFRIDKDHRQIEMEENGKWRALTKEEFEHFHQCKMGHDGAGQGRFQFNGVVVDHDGKVNTDDKVSIGQVTPEGRMVASVPTVDGKPAVITNNPDHTSTLELDHHITKVDPSDPVHLVQRFAENPDGGQGAKEFCFNANDQSFWTPDLTWDANGAFLAWNDSYIDASGSITGSGGQSIYDPSSYAVQSSDNQSDMSCSSADSAIAAVSSKIGSHSLDAGDISMLNSSLGELDGAMSVALSCGNFSAACQIIAAKSELAAAIGEASQNIPSSGDLANNPDRANAA